jgi:hypothetical protein
MTPEDQRTHPVENSDVAASQEADLTPPETHRSAALETPVTRALKDRPPLGPIERLDHDALLANQQS